MTETKVSFSVKTSPVSSANLTIYTVGDKVMTKSYIRSKTANVVQNALNSKGGNTADRLRKKLAINRMERPYDEAVNIYREIEALHSIQVNESKQKLQFK